MLERDLNSFRSFSEDVGPMFGKPSRMNFCWSILDLNVFEGRREIGFFDFFAKVEIRRAVSLGLFEKRIGTW